MKIPRHLKLLGAIVGVMGLTMILAPTALAYFKPSPDCASVNGKYLKKTYNRCMNQGFFTGVTGPETQVDTIPGSTVTLDAQFQYWGLVPFGWEDNWWLPSTCLNQTQMNVRHGNGGPAVCNQDPNYANVFINTISTNLNAKYLCEFPLQNNAYQSCSATRRLAINSALIVATMTPGVKATDFGNNWNTAVLWAQQPVIFNRWANMVRAYAANKQVDWDYGTYELPRHINSTPINYSTDYTFFSWDKTQYPAATVVFRDSAGNPIWELNRSCGNLVGDFRALPDFNVSGLLRSGLGVPVTPPGGTSDAPGGPLLYSTKYQIDSGAWNAGPGPASPQTYTLTLPSGVSPVAGPDPLSPYNGGIWNKVKQTVTWTNVLLPDLGIGKAVYENLYFNVDKVPDNSKITFSLVVGPQDSSGADAPAVTLTYLVQNPRYPSVVGGGSDIHAGGGVCYVSKSNGSISGNTSGISGGQYVVSASANPTSINDFYSNGTSGSSDLNLGAKGGYAQVCRPDLLKNARAYEAAGLAYTTIPSGTTNWSVSGRSGVYFYKGSNLSISGTVDAKMTIVQLGGGKVTVVSPGITINTSAVINGIPVNKDNIPSLGILAEGNIEIDAAATLVEAYMFSDSTIDTCVGGGGSPGCNNVLTINGFVMAQALSLNRLGTLDSFGSVVAENITLNPEIYLNPPTLFDSSMDKGNLQGQGERPPLY